MARTYRHHYFNYKVVNMDGSTGTIPLPVLIRRPRVPVVVYLTSDHVRRALRLDGIGNPQKCAAAVCLMEHASLFGHPVIGTVEWMARTAYVVSKVNPQTNMPSECMHYMHNNGISHMFDTPGGLRKLIRKIDNNGGRWPITLTPAKDRTGTGTTRRGTIHGTRDPNHVVRPHGLRLRTMEALGGNVPLRQESI